MNFENTNIKETKEEGKVESTSEVQDTISKAEAFEKAQADLASSKKVEESKAEEGEGKVESTSEVQDTISKAEAFEKAQADLASSKKVEESKAEEGVGAAQKKIYKFKEGSVGVTVEVDGNQAERIKIPEGLQKLNISVEDIKKLNEGLEDSTAIKSYNSMVLLLAEKLGKSIESQNPSSKDHKLFKNSINLKIKSFLEEEKMDNRILSLRMLVKNANVFGSTNHLDGISNRISKATGYKETNFWSKLVGNKKNLDNIYEQMIADLAKTIGVDSNFVQEVNQAVRSGEKYNENNYSKSTKRAIDDGRTYSGSAGTTGSIIKEAEFVVNFDNIDSKYSDLKSAENKYKKAA